MPICVLRKEIHAESTCAAAARGEVVPAGPVACLVGVARYFSFFVDWLVDILGNDLLTHILCFP